MRIRDGGESVAVTGSVRQRREEQSERSHDAEGQGRRSAARGTRRRKPGGHARNPREGEAARADLTPVLRDDEVLIADKWETEAGFRQLVAEATEIPQLMFEALGY